ncbi:hypothetical protein GLOIN_2v1486568 [Rhizophagus irregularis DAOM 181602=DAOM 197198]|nr:hypothetical protein GLOIN_2v1486568 [Rhizophagus irregularis DAOM 181602=DAOM 197198]
MTVGGGISVPMLINSCLKSVRFWSLILTIFTQFMIILHERNKECQFTLVWYFPGENITDSPINKGISRLGGLDGTNKHGSEDEKIILIRSPPMAGKTTLAQLFENSLLNSDED